MPAGAQALRRQSQSNRRSGRRNEHAQLLHAAACAAAVFAADAGGAAAAEEEKSEFNVELAEVGANKIAVIKVVREITGLGLSEAKALVDNAPSVLKENVPTAEAKEMETKLKEAGATVELK